MSSAAPGEGRAGRGAKRKLQDGHQQLQQQQQQQQQGGAATTGKKGKGGELHTPVLGPNAFPKEYPFNRDGYRYVLAEADPHAPLRREFEDDPAADLAGKPIPGFLCRVLTPQAVLLSMNDRAAQVNVSDDRLTVTGFKFYCTIRANHSVSRGTW